LHGADEQVSLRLRDHRVILTPDCQHRRSNLTQAVLVFLDRHRSHGDETCDLLRSLGYQRQRVPTTHRRGDDHGTVDLEQFEQDPQPGLRRPEPWRRLTVAGQVHGVNEVSRIGEHRHRADLLPGCRRETRPVQQHDRATILRPLDQVVDLPTLYLSPAGLVIDHCFLPLAGTLTVVYSSSTPCSSNHLDNPVSRTAIALAKVTALSSSKSSPLYPRAATTNPKIAWSPIST